MTKAHLVFVFCFMLLAAGLAVRSHIFQTSRFVDVLYVFLAGLLTGVLICGVLALFRGR